MLREPKACHLLAPLCACLCFSVLCEGRLLAQFVTVVDGYDVSLYDRTSPALSFSPFAENHWQLHYTSGRYLREIDPDVDFQHRQSRVLHTYIQDSILFSYQDYFEPKVWLSVLAPGGSWQTKLLDAAGDVGSEVSVTPFSFDKPPAVAYFDRTNGDLKIAHAGGIGSLLDDVNWNVLRVDSEGDVGRLPSTLFTQDTLHAAYVNDSHGILKHGWHLWRNADDFTRWQAEIVDTVGSTHIIPQLYAELVDENFPGIIDAVRERAAATRTTMGALSVYPNPFNAATSIRISPAFTEQISITIYNALGQRVRAFDFVPNRLETQKITWDGRDANGHAVASGIYVVELRTARQKLSQKILLLR